MNPFNYIGPINNTGYGVASISYLNGLLSENQKIYVKPIGHIQKNSDFTPKIEAAISVSNLENAPTFCFWHLHDMPNQLQTVKGNKVGFSTFELDELSDRETAVLSQLSAVGTASHWGAKILAKYTDKPIFVAHHGFKKRDEDVIVPRSTSRTQIFDAWHRILAPAKFSSDTLFLSTAGKFESRKSHPELIDACIELGQTRPVVLIGFLYNPFIPDNLPYDFINSRMLYPVFTQSGIKLYKKGMFYFVMMPPVNSRGELHSALQLADYFISPSKGEGWNLPLFEMMSYGMPCITTLYSAHTDYVTTDNAIIVEHEGLVRALDGKFFHGTGNWANVTKRSILSTISKLEIGSDLSKLSNNAISSTSKIVWHQEARKIQNLMNQY